MSAVEKSPVTRFAEKFDDDIARKAALLFHAKKTPNEVAEELKILDPMQAEMIAREYLNRNDIWSDYERQQMMVEEMWVLVAETKEALKQKFWVDKDGKAGPHAQFINNQTQLLKTIADMQEKLAKSTREDAQAFETKYARKLVEIIERTFLRFLTALVESDSEFPVDWAKSTFYAYLQEEAAGEKL